MPAANSSRLRRKTYSFCRPAHGPTTARAPEGDVPGTAERRSQRWSAERSGAAGASNTLTRKCSGAGARFAPVILGTSEGQRLATDSFPVPDS